MPSAVLIRRSAFERDGLVSVEYPYVNDTEYWLRVLRGGGRIGYSGKTSCLYRQHTGGISRRGAEINEDSARLCEKYAAWSAIPARYKRSRPADLYRWASNAALQENPVRAMQLLKISLRADPFNMKSMFKLVRIASLYLSRLRKTAA
jgi:GT2 family glycosyltransferase